MFDLAVDHDSIWVLSNDEAGVNRVRRIDPASSRIVGDAVTVSAPDGDIPEDIAAGEGGVWLVSPTARSIGSKRGGTLIRIDPATHRIDARIRVGAGASSVAVGGGSVWVPYESDGTVTMIDPVDVRVTGDVEVGERPTGIRFAEGAVWLSALGGDHWLLRIDPSTLKIEKVLYGRMVYAIGEGALWPVRDGGDIGRFDIASRQWGAQRFQLDVEPPAVVTGEGTVWFAKFFYTKPPSSDPGPPQGEIRIWRVNPETFEPLTEKITLSLGPMAANALVAFGAVWIPVPGTGESGEVMRIDLNC